MQWRVDALGAGWTLVWPVFWRALVVGPNCGGAAWPDSLFVAVWTLDTVSRSQLDTTFLPTQDKQTCNTPTSVQHQQYNTISHHQKYNINTVECRVLQPHLPAATVWLWTAAGLAGWMHPCPAPAYVGPNRGHTACVLALLQPCLQTPSKLCSQGKPHLRHTRNSQENLPF